LYNFFSNYKQTDYSVYRSTATTPTVDHTHQMKCIERNYPTQLNSVKKQTCVVSCTPYGIHHSVALWRQHCELSVGSTGWPKKTAHYALVHIFAKYWPIFGRPYYRSCLWYSVSSVCLSSVCDVLYCGKTVRPSEKLSEEVNRKPGSKSWFFGSPPYFYFRFRRYGHWDGRFCLIFARTAKQSVLDGRNWLSSSKPCAYIIYCRIVRSELKPEVVLATFALRESLRPKL